jgi:hypothetical protein
MLPEKAEGARGTQMEQLTIMEMELYVLIKSTLTLTIDLS